MTTARRGTLVALLTAVLAAPALAQTKPPQPAPTTAPAPANVDLMFGAFQRGSYLTAMAEATKRVQQNDPKAMTLLGELYAQGLGVGSYPGICLRRTSVLLRRASPPQQIEELLDGLVVLVESQGRVVA